MGYYIKCTSKSDEKVYWAFMYKNDEDRLTQLSHRANVYNRKSAQHILERIHANPDLIEAEIIHEKSVDFIILRWSL